MASGYGGHSMVAPLRRVIVKRADEAFGSPASVAAQWRALGFNGPPHFERACGEHRQLVAILEEAGCEVLRLPADARTGLDSIYAHDAAIVTDAGAVVFQTGKAARRGEGPALEEALSRWGVPVLARVDGDATAEGGDVLWLDERTLVVARSYRTNAAGVARLREILAPIGVAVVEVHLPHWRGREELLHLLSVVSPLDADLALVHRPLLPVPLVEMLEARGVEMVDVPEEELALLGCNVLALAPRRVAMLSGLPGTRERLEAAGCRVAVFEGEEIGRKGCGGPTCLTRPLLRTA